MKRHLLLLLLAVLPLMSSASDYRILQGSSHPRLMIDGQGFADIIRKTTADSASHRFLTDVNAKLLSMAEEMVASPEDIVYSLDESGKRILQHSRKALYQLSTLSYAFRVTGDSSFSDRARRILSQVCAFKDWNPSHFLDPAEMCLGVSLAYDWLYDVLAPDERAMAERAVTELCLKPGLVCEAFYEAPYNWNQVCNAGMIAGALALYEKETALCDSVLNRSIDSNRRMVGPMYSPDGNYGEGYGYWIYGSGFQAVLMQLLENSLGSTYGIENAPGFMETARYMLFMTGPCGNFSYADGGGGGGVSAATGMWWYAHRAKDLSLLSGEIRNYRNGLYGIYDESRIMTLLPAVARDMDVDAVSQARPAKNIWAGRGKVPVVMVHTGWNYDSTDIYLGIKGGPASSNHGHMDAGSFVYDALGERWSSDLPCPYYPPLEVELGKTGQSYWETGQLSGRWDVFELTSFAHTTILAESGDTTLGRIHPTDFDVKGSSRIVNVIEEPDRLGATLDMTVPLHGQVKYASRTVVLENNRDLVVTDTVTAGASDARMIWHMVTKASVTVSDGFETLSQNGKTMYLYARTDIPVSYISEPFARPAQWIRRPSLDAISDVNWKPFSFSGYTCTVPAGCTVVLKTVLSPVRPQ